MAFPMILRKSTSFAVSLLVQTTRIQRNSTPLKDTIVSHKTCGRQLRQLSSLSEKSNLVRNFASYLLSEIASAEERVNNYPVVNRPDGFQFEIVDKPGLQTILLTKEYNDEAIAVMVHTPNYIQNFDHVNYGKSCVNYDILMIVNVKNGRTCNKFRLRVFPATIIICSVIGMDPNRHSFHERPQLCLNESMVDASTGYLERRGIEPTVFGDFLYKYMVKKERKEYLLWLNKMKNFIDDC